MVDKEQKISALQAYLEVEEEPVEVDDDIYEVDGKGYYVLTREEAKKLAKAHIIDIVDDLGLDLFSPDFLRDNLYDLVDPAPFFAIVQSEIDYLKEFEPEDTDTVEYLDSIKDDATACIDYVEDLLGKEEFEKFVMANDALDIDAVVQTVIDYDGVASTLSTYDNKELDLGNNFYAYRTW